MPNKNQTPNPLNRLIITGNGFDLAHGLPTGYKDFIEDYWSNLITEFKDKIRDQEIYSDFIFEANSSPILSISISISSEFYSTKEYRASRQEELLMGFLGRLDISNFSKFNQLSKNGQVIQSPYDYGDLKFHTKFQNSFLFAISQKSELQTWVDVENEYYKQLEIIIGGKKLNELGQVSGLNGEFEQVKMLLISYLQKKVVNQYSKNALPELKKIFSIASLNTNELSGKFIKENDIVPDHPISDFRVLNFNYTTTSKRYVKDKEKIIPVHGSVNDKENNPIVFGFGDEIVNSYSVLENKDNNEYLKYIKSFQYFQTPHYKTLLDFIDSNPFQVYLMGHSCGLSDRVLLNTIFEHPNCKSIKPFYHEQDGKDNYTDITMNVSRHFKDKAKMREVVVNKKYCQPLPQTKLKKL